MREQLIEILESIDRYLGDYPLLLYLRNLEYNLLWANKYIHEHFPEVKEGIRQQCYRALWGFEEVCPECRKLPKIDKATIESSVLCRIIPGSQEEMYYEFLNLPVLNKEGGLLGAIRIGFDVSAQERAQARLRKREKLYTAIINSSVDAIIFYDREGHIVSWNKGAEDILGYRAEEIIGKSVITLIPKELLELGELYYIRKELEARGFIRRYETQRLHKNGQPVYVDLTSTLVYDEAGQPIGTSEIIKDITSRKELEFELRRTILELSKLNELNEILYSTYAQEEILRLILVAITSGEGLRFNRAFLLLIDKKKKMLQGHLAMGPSDDAEAAHWWGQLKNQHGPLKEVLQFYNTNKLFQTQKANQIVQRIRLPLSRKDHILVHALKTRRLYQVKHGQILKSNAHGFDLDGTDLLKLLGSDTFVVVPLYTKKERLGIIIADNRVTGREITAEDLEGLKLFASQASLAIENARLYRNLEERIQELQTAYEHLEENQERLLRAERLAAIGEMSAKIAHEIRNPLVSIGGFARLIDKNTSEATAIKKYAAVIRDQVSHLENILNNLLNIVNPPRPQRKPLELHEIIHQALVVLGSTLEKLHISVQLHLKCFKGMVLGDEKLLHQAMLNLIKNAIEALESSPNPRQISITSGCDRKQVKLVISDNGPGISPEIQKKVFQPFFTTKSSGTGLGLSIVRQIVAEHQGSVKVRSSTGEGTTIILRFPLYKMEKN